MPGQSPKFPLWGLFNAGRISVVVASLMKVPLTVGPVEKKLPKEKYCAAVSAGSKVATTADFMSKEVLIMKEYTEGDDKIYRRIQGQPAAPLQGGKRALPPVPLNTFHGIHSLKPKRPYREQLESYLKFRMTLRNSKFSEYMRDIVLDTARKRSARVTSISFQISTVEIASFQVRDTTRLGGFLVHGNLERVHPCKETEARRSAATGGTLRGLLIGATIFPFGKKGNKVGDGFVNFRQMREN